MRPVAVLHTTLDELARVGGIRPETQNGNLGTQREALLEADDGSQYMLVEFREGPTHDVELRAEEHVPNPNAATDRFIETLGLSPDVVIWRVTETDWGLEDDAPRQGSPVLAGSETRAGEVVQPGDGLVLIDTLNDLVQNARAVPLTDQVRVDKEKIYDILDQMRATIPEEIKQARWIVKERQEMLAEAKHEADRIVNEARERQERIVSEEQITRQAERAAEDIIGDARAREREIRLDAEDYADEILNTLEVNLSKFIAAVRRGRDRLAAEQHAEAPDAGTHLSHS